MEAWHVDIRPVHTVYWFAITPFIVHDLDGLKYQPPAHATSELYDGRDKIYIFHGKFIFQFIASITFDFSNKPFTQTLTSACPYELAAAVYVAVSHCINIRWSNGL